MFDSKLKRILVPACGSPVDEAALALACGQAKRDRAEVVVLYVIEVRRTLPLDADMGPELERGEHVLEELSHIGQRLGARIQSDLLQAREAGPAIASEAAERQVDLIVMGVPYKEKFGTFAIDPPAEYVLEHAPCRVLLVRDPLAAATPRT